MRYNRVAEMALSDPGANFTPEERARIVGFIEPVEDGQQEGYTEMLRVRLTRTQMDTIEEAARKAGMNTSDYVRSRIGV